MLTTLNNCWPQQHSRGGGEITLPKARGILFGEEGFAVASMDCKGTSVRFTHIDRSADKILHRILRENGYDTITIVANVRFFPDKIVNSRTIEARLIYIDDVEILGISEEKETMEALTTSN